MQWEKREKREVRERKGRRHKVQDLYTFCLSGFGAGAGVCWVFTFAAQTGESCQVCVKKELPTHVEH